MAVSREHTEHTASPDVVVVGGGIGGLSTAYALSRVGLEVRLLERAPEFGEIGAGLQIAPNCTRILDEYGLLEEVTSLGVLPDDMIMFDGVGPQRSGEEMTRLDLHDLEKRYGFPYVVIHRSDLHGILLRACQRRGVQLVNGATAVDYESGVDEHGRRCATVILENGTRHTAPIVIAAEGIHSPARARFVGDDPVSSSYVAYRGAIPMAEARENNIHEKAVVLYLGNNCHFVQYGLRGGEMFNQVAVFESPAALAGDEDWGTPDELDAAFADTVGDVQDGLKFMWRDRWWRMYDRESIPNWIFGRVALLGDSAHAPLQYIAQGAIMAIEDGWVLAKHVEMNRSPSGEVDWDTALQAYNAVRTQHTARVLATSREWGILWHHVGVKRRQRNAILRARDVYDYSFVDWLYGPTALFPEDEAEMFTPIPLESAVLAQSSGS
ncbi:FAD-dependent oxidoreductase [Nocardioides marmotae]|uniref:FAD-dependent oxidoreductase n=1 Tax=Nocardioides marmotae TaxID=2663857 RepID=UPI0012B655D6|nr:FAD-dependent oxidoreductase [Nocardioides marmotae]MBC9731606.1 FAD-dependent oxidoreductase [Nocardioides marmotae]MTB82728.1 FAD-dependent oxidoreductase [Nocardioides marmotae]